MQTRVARRLDRIITVSESSRHDIVKDHGVDARAHARRAGRRRPRRCSGRSPASSASRAGSSPRRRADVTMKGLRYLLEAVAKLRTERDISLVVIGRPKEGGRSAETIERLGLTDVVSFVTGVTDERIYELYSEAELAVVPSLYEGFSLPAIEAMSCGVPLVSTTGGALPEVVGADGDTALLVAARRQRGARGQDPHGARRPRAARRGRRAGPPAGHRQLELAAHRRAHARAVPGAAAETPRVRCGPAKRSGSERRGS